MKTRINEVRLGTVAPFGPNGETSAYRKYPVSGPVNVGPLGLAGDEQADPRYHGGPEKAVLHYAHEHYEQWRIEQPSLAEHFAEPGAFGENLSTTGMTEETVCIGDRFRLGTAIVEVCQGRQPCWKLGHRFAAPHMVAEVLKSRRGGWYYRVIENGTVSAGDIIELVDRRHAEWPVALVAAQLLGGENDSASLRQLAALAALSSSWRDRAKRILATSARRQDAV